MKKVLAYLKGAAPTALVAAVVCVGIIKLMNRNEKAKQVLS